MSYGVKLISGAYIEGGKAVSSFIAEEGVRGEQRARLESIAFLKGHRPHKNASGAYLEPMCF